MNVNEIKYKISENRIEEAIKMLKIGVNPDSAMLNEVYLLESRYISLKKLKRQGLISNSDIQIEKNKIVNYLLEVIQRIDENEFSDEYENKKVLSNKLSKIGIFISIISVVAAIAGFVADLANFNLFNDEYNTVTLIVHDKEGKDQRILNNEGEIALLSGNMKLTSKIDENGKAVFNGLPSDWIGKSFSVSLEGTQQKYKIIEEKEYTFEKEGVIYIPIETKFIIKGIINDIDSNAFIQNVRVQVNELETYSDELGRFSLTIPNGKEYPSFEISFMKEGYQTKTLMIPKIDNEIVRIILEKK